jgi:hypothetical protein
MPNHSWLVPSAAELSHEATTRTRTILGFSASTRLPLSVRAVGAAGQPFWRGSPSTPSLVLQEGVIAGTHFLSLHVSTLFALHTLQEHPFRTTQPSFGGFWTPDLTHSTLGDRETRNTESKPCGIGLPNIELEHVLDYLHSFVLSSRELQLPKCRPYTRARIH